MAANRRMENEPFELPCPVCEKPVRYTLERLLAGGPLLCMEGHGFSVSDYAGLPEIIRFLADLDSAVERYDENNDERHPASDAGAE